MNLNGSESIICRICLSSSISLSNETFLSINDYAKSLNFENLLIKQMIEKSVSEIDLDICDSPIICTPCYNLLVSSYIFKSKCYQTEQNIYFYMENNGLKVGDKIDLKHVTQSLATCKEDTKNILTESFNSNETTEDILIVDTKEAVICIIESNTDNADIDLDPDYQTDDDKTGSLYRKRSHTCHKCEYKTYRYDLLKKHLGRCKNHKMKKMFKCDMCAYATCRKRHLTRHTMVHGGDRPYICGICNKGFTEKFHLRNHMYKHTGDLPFKCEEENCDSSFARKSDLNVHILKHSKYKPYICKTCKKGFLTEEQFTNHTKNHK